VLDFRHNADHFFYAEIVLDWIRSTKPPLLVVKELWESIKQDRLNYPYVCHLWRSIKSLYGNLDYSTMPVDRGEPYKYTVVYGFNAGSDNIKIGLKKSPVRLLTFHYDVCQMKGCTLKTRHELAFKLIPGTPCYKLATENDFDREQGHYHHDKLKHFYATVEDEDGHRVILSFVTNTLSEVFTKVRTSKNIHLRYLFEF